MMDVERMETHYGKAAVAVYRTYGRPLRGVTAIPESAFTGRSNTLMAAELDVRVMGSAFAAAYTDGDNRLVVPTDTMKNFIHAQSLSFGGDRLEQWLWFVGRRFLETYPHMERLRMSGVELPFPAAIVPADERTGGATEAGTSGFTASEVLFERDRGDRSTAWLELSRGMDGSVGIAGHGCGRVDLQFIKITGSAFADFPRDAHTTLPERRDRPLYTWLDVGWRYVDVGDALAEVPAGYVAGEQVADLCAAVFHQFVSLSIQHLVHEMAQRMLARWPQLAEVSFEAQNRLWDSAEASTSDERVRTYCDPRPPYGRIGLVLRGGG
jgi:urate oxidase / 2-oxo-4-hydroxy-4-carboxy-5-ureidoimidazoline decarboxylase